MNDESRVLEVVDPTKVEVDGLLDAADVDFVQEGARALVTIDALGGQVLDGRVSYIAAEPRTESGTVSYPVTVVIEVPRRVEIPVGLSAVSTVVILQ